MEDRRFGQMLGADLGLLEQWRDEAIAGFAMLDAFTDGVNFGVECLHGVVNDDALVAMQAGIFGERDIGPDADRHDDDVGF